MSEICEHDTFKDICLACHRGDTITRLTAENERLRAALEKFACSCTTSCERPAEDQDSACEARAAIRAMIKEKSDG